MTSPQSLPAEALEFNCSKSYICYRSKCESQLKPNITSKWTADVLPNRSNEPYLRHAHDCAKHTKAECSDGGVARRKVRGFVVCLRDVTLKAFSENEVFGERDGFVYCEPVSLRGRVLARTARNMRGDIQ